MHEKSVYKYTLQLLTRNLWNMIRERQVQFQSIVDQLLNVLVGSLVGLPKNCNCPPYILARIS